MMVALFIYAYSIGVRSSRQIERRCTEDVAFRVICAGQTPDHATIARFRARHEQAIAELFGGVLELCARSGLVKVGVVSVDGTKIAAAATHHANRTYQQIAEEILKEAAAIDADEDELYGEARGDELPEGFRTPNRAPRRSSRGKAKARGRAQGEREAGSARPPKTACRVQKTARSRIGARAPRRRRARGVAKARDRKGRLAPHDRPQHKAIPMPEKPTGKINVTDPDSRNLKTTRGWVQGYNAQAVVTADQS